MPHSALPEPMLAKSGRLPTRAGYAYEVKWDGFRAIVSTEGPLRVRSRRGWNMTPHVGFLEQLPVRAVLDGELVAFDSEGKPDFERVCERIALPTRRRSADLPRLRCAQRRRQRFEIAAAQRAPADPRGTRARTFAVAGPGSFR